MKKGFKQRLVLLLSFVMLLETASPSVLGSTAAFAAGAEDAVMAGADQMQEVTVQDLAELEEAAEAGDPDEVPPESQDASNYFTEEEIAAAEAFYALEEAAEAEPTEEEILAEKAEKDRLDAEEQAKNVDDTDKLADSDDELEPVGARYNVKVRINNKDREAPINNQIGYAIQNRLPIHMINNVDLNETAVIPKNKSLTIYLRGYSFYGGDKLGNNPLFKLQEGSELLIYGLGNNQNGLKWGKDGAVVANKGSHLRLESLQVIGNTANRNGGGIYLGEKVNCELYNVKIKNNKAGNCGGGLYVAGTLTNVHFDADTELINNEADDGAGIYINKSKVNLYGPAAGKVKIYNNYAKSSGGGIYLNAKDINGGGFDIRYNQAQNGYGGGVRMQITQTSLTNCDIKNNSATKDGGGVYVNGKVGTLTDVDIQGNQCGENYNGGGIYVDSMDNLGSGGKFIVTKNYRGNSSQERFESDLFLQNGKTSNAYLHAASYAPGSKIGVGVTDWKEGQRITFAPGSFNPKLFYCNNGLATNKKGTTWYVAHNQNSKDGNYRHLVITSSKASALVSEKKEISGRSTAKNSKADAGLSYTATDGSTYPVYYGYASSPSHTDETKDIVTKYFYSDGYFMDDPMKYNTHLAAFGMNLAMASADSNIGSHSDYTFKFDNVKSVMQGMGCAEEDIYISPSYVVKPTDSSIGVAIGSKTITDPKTKIDYTLVPIAIRSYGYEKEWASNMTIDGENTKGENNAETSGFRDARTKVMNAVKSYIASYGLDAQLSQGRVKFFLVGFSRGSATANLTSKALVDTYGELSDKYKSKPNQVFGYCYAVPSGATDTCDTSLTKNRKAYYCIHNIINKVDLTPLVAPKEMGFKRYGVDHFVPGNDAGTVKTAIDYAKQDNGSYKITMFYDNDAWYTDSSAYATQKASMEKQLMLVNDEIHFVDWFKETDLDVGKLNGIKSALKGLLTESSAVEMNPVANSKKTLETWLPEFYATIQDYNTLGEETKINRKNYSSVVVKAGKDDTKKHKLKKGEKNWYSKGQTAQNTFRGLVQMLLSKTPAEKQNLGAAFSGMGNKIGMTKLLGIFEKLINSDTGWDYSQERQQDYLDYFWTQLKDNRYGQKAIQDAITDPQEMAELENYYPSLMSIIFRVVRQDYNDKRHKNHMRLAGSFAANAEAILQGHVPEIYCAWLRSYDSYYANEGTAYRWASEAGTPGKVNFYVSANGTEAAWGYEDYDNLTTLNGDQTVKLKAEKSGDAVYYYIADATKNKDERGNNSVRLLYNAGQGIKLAAPKEGQPAKIYKVYAFTKNSYSTGNGNITWKKSDADWFRYFKVAPAIPEGVHLKLVKHYYDGNTGRWVETADPTVVHTGVPFKLNNRFSVDLKTVKEIDLEKYYVKSWSAPKQTGSMDINTTVISFIPEYKDQETVTVELFPRIHQIQMEADKVKKYRPEPGKKFGKNHSGNSYMDFADVQGLYYDNEEKGALDLYNPASIWCWEEKNADGRYVRVKDNVAKPGTQYRMTIKARRSGTSVYTKPVSVVIDGKKQDIMPRWGGDVYFTVEFGKTESIDMDFCSANEAEGYIWKETEGDQYNKMRENIKSVLPKYAGTLSAGGKTVSGLKVEWDTGNIPDAALDGSEVLVKGLITDTKGFENCDWSDWKEAHPGLGEFQVQAVVHIIEKEKLLPPAVDVQGGRYTLGYDEIPQNEADDVVITLTDLNEGVEHRVRYKIQKDGEPEGEYQEGSSVILEKPEEGETVSYKVTLSCDSPDISYVVASKEVSYTYELFNPIVREVYGFATDINDEPEITEEFLKDEENTEYIDEAQKGEEVLVYYEDLADEEDEGRVEFVSWNEITVSDGSVNTKRLPDAEDVLWYTVSDNDVYLQALTAPVLDEVDIDLEKPETGYGLPDMPDGLQLTIGGDLYEIDPASVSVNWSASENSIDDGLVKSKTTYTAEIIANVKDIECYDKELDYKEKLDLQFFAFEDEADVTANGIRIEEVSEETASENGITGISFQVSKNEVTGLAECLTIYLQYNKSGQATFLSVEPPQGLAIQSFTTSENRYEKEVKPNLPAEAAVLVDDGSVQTLSVNWAEDLTETIYDDEGNPISEITNGVAYEKFGYVVSANDLDGLEDWSLSMNGYVEIPEDLLVELDEETGEPLNEDIIQQEDGSWRCYFEYPVFLAGAPETNMPEILPMGGEYEPTTENVVVEFNTFPVSTSTNHVDVYYKITYHQEDEEAEEDDYDDEPPVYYDEEKGSYVIAEDACKYTPYDASKDNDAEAEEDYEERCISREKVEQHSADYAVVTAVAWEQGDYRISEAAEEYYYFLDKPTADIPEEVLDALNSLTLETGKQLSSIKLPDNCRWTEETDIYKIQDDIEKEYVEAVVAYNDDAVNYNDRVLVIKIELIPGYYDITATDCLVYDMNESPYEEDWLETKKAQAGSMIHVSANEPGEGLELLDWILTDAAGNDLDYDYGVNYGSASVNDADEEVDYYAIEFKMPYSNVRVKPVWHDQYNPVAPVLSLTLDQPAVELRKGADQVITATAVYGDSEEDAKKPEIHFETSNPQVATVTSSGGKATIHATGSGKATIWVDCADKSASCIVTVGETFVNLSLTRCKAYDVSSETGQAMGEEAVKGTSIRLVADEPENPALRFKEWTITGAEIDKTKNPVTFKLMTDLVAAAEYETDPAFADPGEYAFKDKKVKSLKLTDAATGKKAGNLAIALNGQAEIIAKAVYNNKETEKPPIVFRSANTDVAKIKTVSGAEGEAKAVIVGCKPGTAVITAYCGNKTTKLTATVADAEVTKIVIWSERLEPEMTDDGQYRLELNTGEQEYLEVLPYDLYNTTPMKVTWKSDDPKVASVKNGIITAKTAEKGHTTITATAKVKAYGSKKWVSLKPVKIVVRVRSIEIPKNVRNDKTYKLTLKKNQALDLTAAAAAKKNVVSSCVITAKATGSAPAGFDWKSTNEEIVTVVPDEKNPTSASIQAVGLGTAYVVVSGKTGVSSNQSNQAVMKVTVKASAPELSFTGDSLNALSADMKTLTLKQGSYDRIQYSAFVKGAKYGYNVSEKISWSAKGGVTVTDGVIYAKKVTKDGKPAKVTLKCGKSKIELDVIVK